MEELPLTLGASALARVSGVSTDTLRHYERKGLLAPPPRTAAGYRRYPREAIARVQLIQRALVIGFSLEELARVLRERQSGGAPCQKVRGIVAARLVALERQLTDLKTLKRDLRSLLDDWDTRLGSATPGSRAHLLETLAHRPSPQPAAAARVGVRRRR